MYFRQSTVQHNTHFRFYLLDIISYLIRNFDYRGDEIQIQAKYCKLHTIKYKLDYVFM